MLYVHLSIEDPMSAYCAMPSMSVAAFVVSNSGEMNSLIMPMLKVKNFHLSLLAIRYVVHTFNTFLHVQ